MTDRRSGLTALVVALIVVVCGGAGYYFAHRSKTDHARTQASAAPTAPPAVTAATQHPSMAPSASDLPTPNPAALAHTLDTLLTDPAYGTQLLGTVVDPSDGRVLYNRSPGTPGTPASTAKLLTAVAALTALHPDGQITTRAVAGATAGQIVLVGGGDPTLTAARGAAGARYPGAARLADLAAALTRAHVQVSSIVVDDSRFSGPSVSPDWSPDDVPSEYASAITATMVDGGRAAPTDSYRTDQPDLAAGHALAGLLGHANLPVSTGTAPAGARQLATVQSAPVLTLVTQMLQESDNVIAECLGRLVAIAEHQPASFVGAAAAIVTVLHGLDVTEAGVMHDASGLAVDDRLSPGTLVAVMRLIVGGSHPELHDIVTALPVAAWSGTLEDRYVAGSDATAGAGVVRAKTGTLTSVSTLAGMVHDADGRLLVFAFIADQAPSSFDAELALDRLAAALAGCGCR